MRVLVTGAGGQLGQAITARFARDGDVIAATRAELDIADEAAVLNFVRTARPDAIVNCAAYNLVDQAEETPVPALEVNAFAVLALARAAVDAGAVFVHYSTDFVFDGTTDRPYVEDDEPQPRSQYGASKLLGEWFAAEAPAHYVLRVESLFGGAVTKGSLGTIAAQIDRGERVRVFTDRTVSPSYVHDVADATAKLLDVRPAFGLYHAVNSGAATWKEIAEEVARLLGRTPLLEGVTLEEVSMKAARPKYCALSNAKLAAAGVVMPTWQDALARYLRSGTV